jgi:hypothetical protein
MACLPALPVNPFLFFLGRPMLIPSCIILQKIIAFKRYKFFAQALSGFKQLYDLKHIHFKISYNEGPHQGSGLQTLTALRHAALKPAKREG